MRVMVFFFSLVLAALALASPAQAAGGKCDKVNDPLCEKFNQRAAKPVPYDKCLIRVRILQRGMRKVTIMFYGSDGKELNVVDKLHTTLKKGDDTFATGCGWWEKAAKVVICNDEVTRTAYPEMIALYIKQKGTADGHWVDLRPR